MAHINCPKCGKEVGIKEEGCPKCNDPFMSNSCGASNTTIIIVIAIVVIIGLIALTCAGL
ncbi:MAG: hypothetical protein DHS20C13_20690 [Thermodesulfobacteriota bacterium]|nr:MAG: hypothetical protein DHS20C13_20690 [Thermodesulfobacteriota bacterium]